MEKKHPNKKSHHHSQTHIPHDYNLYTNKIIGLKRIERFRSTTFDLTNHKEVRQNPVYGDSASDDSDIQASCDSNKRRLIDIEDIAPIRQKKKAKLSLTSPSHSTSNPPPNPLHITRNFTCVEILVPVRPDLHYWQEAFKIKTPTYNPPPPAACKTAQKRRRDDHHRQTKKKLLPASPSFEEPNSLRKPAYKSNNASSSNGSYSHGRKRKTRDQICYCFVSSSSFSSSKFPNYSPFSPSMYPAPDQINLRSTVPQDYLIHQRSTVSGITKSDMEKHHGNLKDDDTAPLPKSRSKEQQQKHH